MAGSARRPSTVDEYLEGFPEEIRDVLERVRRTIREAAPQATESISYGMPAYKLNGKPVAYFGAHTRHIGFYPTPAPLEEFAADLAGYKVSKGAVQLPLDRPIPYDLVTRMVRARVRIVTGGTGT